MMKYFIFGLLIFFLACFIWFKIRKNFKVINTPAFTLVTGGVKTGKSKLCVFLSTIDFKKIHLLWSIKKFFCKLLHKKFLTEEPFYYTNCLVSFRDIEAYSEDNKKRKFFKKKPHRLDRCIKQITLDSLLRNERYNYKSIIYINEASLMADNMDVNNIERNIQLSLWAKLIAHMTRGGKVYVDTQSVLDVHYSFKRVCSTYLFIQKRKSFFFFDLLWVREMINTENGVNNFEDDVDFSTRKVIVPRWYNKKYDRYEFSYLTDELSCSDVRFVPKSGLVSFNPRYRSMSYRHKKEESN